MKIYAPKEGFTKQEMDRGDWILFADVQCINPECRATVPLSNVGNGAQCPKCGQICI